MSISSRMIYIKRGVSSFLKKSLLLLLFLCLVFVSLYFFISSKGEQVEVNTSIQKLEENEKDQLEREIFALKNQISTIKSIRDQKNDAIKLQLALANTRRILGEQEDMSDELIEVFNLASKISSVSKVSSKYNGKWYGSLYKFPTNEELSTLLDKAFKDSEEKKFESPDVEFELEGNFIKNIYKYIVDNIEYTDKKVLKKLDEKEESVRNAIFSKRYSIALELLTKFESNSVIQKSDILSELKTKLGSMDEFVKFEEEIEGILLNAYK